MKGLVSHDEKFALYPKDSGKPFHDLFCLLERSLWLIAETRLEGPGLWAWWHREVDKCEMCLERRGDFLCESWGEGANDETQTRELSGWCWWRAQERSSVQEANEESVLAIWGCRHLRNTVAFLLTTAMCAAKNYIVHLPLQLRNGEESRGSDINNITINTISEFPSSLQFVSHWPEQCQMSF